MRSTPSGIQPFASSRGQLGYEQHRHRLAPKSSSFFLILQPLFAAVIPERFIEIRHREIGFCLPPHEAITVDLHEFNHTQEIRIDIASLCLRSKICRTVDTEGNEIGDLQERLGGR